MDVSPKHICKRSPVSSSSKLNLKKIWGVEKKSVKNRLTWEIKKKLAERRLMDLDLPNKKAHTGNIVLPTVCYEAEPITCIRPDNCVDASTSPMARAQKVQEKLSPQFPSFLKLMLGSHVSGGFWLGLPKGFCDLHFPKQDDTIVLVDEDEQEYNTRYLVNKNGLSGGWRGFSIAHKLLAGDVLIFQLVEPCKIKVYIVRASGLAKVDGTSGLLNLDIKEKATNPVKRAYQPEDNVIVAYQSGKIYNDGASGLLNLDIKEMATNPVKRVNQPEDNVIVADQSGKIYNDLGSEDVERIRFSQTNIKFSEMKCFKDFNINVNGEILDSEIPPHLRMKYYNLCCSQNKFLHENLVEGLNSELVKGMIFEIISTADTIKSVKLTTPLYHLEAWDKKLKAFEDLGMAVGFLRSRIHQLVTLSQESQVIESKKKERDEAEVKLKALEARLLNVKAVVKSLNIEIHKLEGKHRELDFVFEGIARAVW